MTPTEFIQEGRPASKMMFSSMPAVYWMDLLTSFSWLVSDFFDVAGLDSEIYHPLPMPNKRHKVSTIDIPHLQDGS